MAGMGVSQAALVSCCAECPRPGRSGHSGCVAPSWGLEAGPGSLPCPPRLLAPSWLVAGPWLPLRARAWSFGGTHYLPVDSLGTPVTLRPCPVSDWPLLVREEGLVLLPQAPLPPSVERLLRNSVRASSGWPRPLAIQGLLPRGCPSPRRAPRTSSTLAEASTRATLRLPTSCSPAGQARDPQSCWPSPRQMGAPGLQPHCTSVCLARHKYSGSAQPSVTTCLWSSLAPPDSPGLCPWSVQC